uniref:Uncharacterized protein n=1 Tax=Oryza punctata TaxID=4537 RepID=A0A0E0L911_ORYPU
MTYAASMTYGPKLERVPAALLAWDSRRKNESHGIGKRKIEPNCQSVLHFSFWKPTILWCVEAEAPITQEQPPVTMQAGDSERTRWWWNGVRASRDTIKRSRASLSGLWGMEYGQTDVEAPSIARVIDAGRDTDDQGGIAITTTIGREAWCRRVPTTMAMLMSTWTRALLGEGETEHAEVAELDDQYDDQGRGGEDQRTPSTSSWQTRGNLFRFIPLYNNRIMQQLSQYGIHQGRHDTLNILQLLYTLAARESSRAAAAGIGTIRDNLGCALRGR